MGDHETDDVKVAVHATFREHCRGDGLQAKMPITALSRVTSDKLHASFDSKRFRNTLAEAICQFPRQEERGSPPEPDKFFALIFC